MQNTLRPKVLSALGHVTAVLSAPSLLLLLRHQLQGRASSRVAMENLSLFLVALGGALAVGLASVVLVLTWVLHFREGLAWDGGAAEFNWHPVLVVTGFIFWSGLGEWTVRTSGGWD